LNKSPESGPDDAIALNRLSTVARVLPGTAHDVNNALQIIGGSAELLENQGGLTDAAKRALARIRTQAARAAGLLDELSQFARDREELPARVALREVIVKAAAFRGLMIRRAGLAFVFDTAGAPLAEVNGRPGQLLQAVINMIIDAEQAFTAPARGSITVQLAEEAGEAVLRVLDDGRDRPAGTRVRTVESGGAMRPGEPGAGLAAARLIARAHGGDLTSDPAASGGSLTLRLPLMRRT
jgi:C4-dicarboxylate-specific signal transduction histidine kinase